MAVTEQEFRETVDALILEAVGEVKPTGIIKAFCIRKAVEMLEVDSKDISRLVESLDKEDDV